MNMIGTFLRSRRRRLAGWSCPPGLAGLFLTGLLPCAAHQWSDAHLDLTLAGDRLRGQWTVALRDLEDTVGLDANGDRTITWGEVRQRREHLIAHAWEHLRLRANGRDVTLSAEELRIDDHHHDEAPDQPGDTAAGPGAYLVLPFSAGLPPGARQLEVEYDFLFALDPEHRGRLRVREAGRVVDAVLQPGRPRVTFTRPRGWLAGMATTAADAPVRLLAVGGTVSLLAWLGWVIRRVRDPRA